MFLLHGPGHSSEEYKVLKESSKTYAVQRPHKDNEAQSGDKKIVVILSSPMEESRRPKSLIVMIILQKKEGKKLAKKRRVKSQN